LTQKDDKNMQREVLEAFKTNSYCASVKVSKLYATRRTIARASSGLQVGIDDKSGPIHSHVWHRLDALIW